MPQRLLLGSQRRDSASNSAAVNGTDPATAAQSNRGVTSWSANVQRRVRPCSFIRGVGPGCIIPPRDLPTLRTVLRDLVLQANQIRVVVHLLADNPTRDKHLAHKDIDRVIY